MALENNTKTRINLSLDYRIIVLMLLAVIGGMLFTWKPWDAARNNSTRTIEVTGEAKISAEPDEFVFYPSYEAKNADKQVAINELGKKSEELVAKLKGLGVSDAKIKTDSSGYGGGDTYPGYPEKQQDPTYTLRLTVTVGTRELAQKVQDYLVTTAPSGAVSPQPSFSDAKRKQLEGQARDNATKEARAKADQSARNLGFKVGSVKSVVDGVGFGGITPLQRAEKSDAATATPQLSVQPGENELQYSVTVVYFVK